MKDDYNTKFSLHHLCIFSLKGWENVLFELRSKRVKRNVQYVSEVVSSYESQALRTVWCNMSGGLQGKFEIYHS